MRHHRSPLLRAATLRGYPFALRTDMAGFLYRHRPECRTDMRRNCVPTWTGLRTPHLNGKVEHSQKTDLQEFWANRGLPKLDDSSDLECWQFDYNWRRPHGSLGGKTPAERVAELIDVTPLREDVADAYDPSSTRDRNRVTAHIQNCWHPPPASVSLSEEKVLRRQRYGRILEDCKLSAGTQTRACAILVIEESAGCLTVDDQG